MNSPSDPHWGYFEINRMIKAVFFDLDGTLVSFKTHQIPQTTRKALDILQQKGIKVFISTGRHKATIDNIGDWQPDGYVVLNGGMCVVNDEVLFERHIPDEDIQSLLTYLKEKEQFPCVFLLKDELIMNFENQHSKDVFNYLNFAMPTVSSLEEASKEPVYELLVVNTQEEQDRLMPFLPNCDFTRSHPHYGDVIPKGSNKAIGIQKMMDHFGFQKEETVAFGDGNNDLEMIKHVGIGVAMGNGSDALKDVADMVTDSVDEDGVWNALKKLGLV